MENKKNKKFIVCNDKWGIVGLDVTLADVKKQAEYFGINPKYIKYGPFGDRILCDMGPTVDCEKIAEIIDSQEADKE